MRAVRAFLTKYLQRKRDKFKNLFFIKIVWLMLKSILNSRQNCSGDVIFTKSRDSGF